MSIGFRRGQGGFTLVEVMAAFAIFAVIFAAVMQILSTALSNTRRSEHFTEAALWAQSKLDTVGIEGPLEPGVESGEFNDTFEWEMDVSEHIVVDDRGLDTEELPVNLYRVVLTVHWRDGDRRRSAEFETLRAVDRYFEERRQGRAR